MKNEKLLSMIDTKGFVRVYHEKGKHMANLNATLYVIRKMLFAEEVKVTVMLGGGAFTERHINDWQKACGWKRERLTLKGWKKISETLIAWRFFSSKKKESCCQTCEYRRDPEHYNGNFYTLNVTDYNGEFPFISSHVIKRRKGEWMVAWPWVEGVKSGSTLKNPVAYWLKIEGA
jgi:hypothetical protein